MLEAPSPKKLTATRSRPRRRNAMALPVAIGMLAPTMALETIAPTEKSARCIWPPLPPTQPVALPQISAVIASQRRALGDQMPDRPVGAVDDVVAPQRRADADGDRFLALALMQRAGHQALQEQVIEVFLVAADEHHRAEGRDELLGEKACAHRPAVRRVVLARCPTAGRRLPSTRTRPSRDARGSRLRRRLRASARSRLAGSSER